MNKRNSNSFRKISLVAALLMAGCLSEQSGSKGTRMKASVGGTVGSVGSPIPGVTPTSTPIGGGGGSDTQPVASILAANSIMSSMAGALGLKYHYDSSGSPQYDNTAGHVFASYSLWFQLPIKGTASDVSVGNLLAIKKLAVATCNSLYWKEYPINYADPQRVYFKDINFARAISTLTVDERKMVLQRFSNSILGRNLSTAQMDIFLNLLSGVQSDISSMDENPHLLFWSAPCIVFLTSMDFLEG